MNLRCYLLSLLRIHSPSCKVCDAREAYGLGMRKRLEELNWGRQPHEVDSDEVVRAAVSLRTEKRKKIA